MDAKITIVLSKPQFYDLKRAIEDSILISKHIMEKELEARLKALYSTVLTQFVFPFKETPNAIDRPIRTIELKAQDQTILPSPQPLLYHPTGERSEYHEPCPAHAA